MVGHYHDELQPIYPLQKLENEERGSSTDIDVYKVRKARKEPLYLYLPSLDCTRSGLAGRTLPALVAVVGQCILDLVLAQALSDTKHKPLSSKAQRFGATTPRPR